MKNMYEQLHQIPLIYVLLKDLPNSVNFWSVLHEHFVQGSGVNCYLVNVNFALKGLVLVVLITYLLFSKVWLALAITFSLLDL